MPRPREGDEERLPLDAPRLLAARFVERPNRFLVRARLGRRTVEAHLPDPGRLRELLLPNVPIRLAPAAPGAARRTRYTVALVRNCTGTWVSLDTAKANTLARQLLLRGAVHGLPRTAALRAEASSGSSRFDFALEGPDRRRWWIEVKSVTYVERGIARFPDAPTTRGTRHVRELAERTRRGEQGLVLFVVQREDAHRVTPFVHIDPAFATALRDARSEGVLLRAARFAFSANGRADYRGPVPVRIPQAG